ncbi:hypothetical protein [Nocardia carnea]|uniref:hypothetical protein n=1 Tax=Nocardia carnea TaxID=37328 RepID=UPI00245759F2|nr:hypothetical protein [Nocardia carnea]
MTRVDPRPAPTVKTPGRRANQWLRSGQVLNLRIPCSGCGWMPGACQCHHRDREQERIELTEDES